MTRDEMRNTAIVLNTMFSQFHFQSGSETLIQDQIAEVFNKLGVPFLREYKLNETERPDFVMAGGLMTRGDLCPPLLAIEVKIEGSANAILRQVKRYTDHWRICGCILVSTKPIVMPPELSEKPVCNLALWKQLM